MGEVGGLYQQLGFSVSPGQIRRGSCPKRQRKGQEQGQEQEQVTWLEECLTLQLSSLASLELMEVLGRTSISYWNRWTIDPPLYDLHSWKIRSLLRMAQLFQPNLWCLQLWYVTCWQCYVRLEVILRDVQFSFAIVRWCWSRCVSFFSTQYDMLKPSLVRYDDYEEPKAGETSGDGTKLNSWVFIFWVARKTQ